MKIYIVGIGMDGSRSLTQQAITVIRQADILIGAKRMLEPFHNLQKPMFTSYQPQEIADFLRENAYENPVILMSGDCGFFSGATPLLSKLNGIDTEIICGIASPVYFSSRIGIPWQDMRFFSLHGQNNLNLIRTVCRNRCCFFLLDHQNTSAAVCRKLSRFGLGQISVFIGENLSYPSEQIYSGTADELKDLETQPLAVMVTVNPDYEQSIPSGIPDDKFTRGNVPMTKSEIRAAVIAKLSIPCHAVCWDIGAGTGSVSVEMAMQAYEGTVFAIDQNEEAAMLVTENAVKFGCDNITVLHAQAPDCLRGLPPPDIVFIGGSCGTMREIRDIVKQKNPNAAVLVTAVTLETLEQTGKLLRDPEITQIAVTRTRKVGSHTMFHAENPIFIIKGAFT